MNCTALQEFPLSDLGAVQRQGKRREMWAEVWGKELVVSGCLSGIAVPGMCYGSTGTGTHQI